MYIEIQRNAGASISDQIYQSIVDHIHSGLLQEGARLPSVRNQSKQLGVSLVTVVKAYKKLEDDNYIISVQGKGTFVTENKEREVLVEGTSPFDRQLAFQDYLPRAQFARFLHTSERIQLSSSMVDPGLLPTQWFEREISQILSRNPRVLSRYAEIQGDSQLRNAISQYLDNLGVTTTPEHILITNGTQQGLDLIARTFIGSGDVVVTEAPTYPGAIDVFRGRGATILSVPVDSEGIRVDLLQNICDKYKPKIIYTTAPFHNPTGTVMSLKRQRQILEIAQSIQCIIIEDDSSSEIYYEKKPPAPIKNRDTSGHVIYLKGLSKILAPGCRTGVLVASGSIFNRLYAAKANADLGNSLLTQKTILPLIESPKMQEHLRKLRIALKLRRDLVLALLSEHAPSGITWLVPQGGLNLWISLPSWMNADHLLIEAKKQQLNFLPGSACYPVEQENHHLRLSFSYVNENLLSEGIKILCTILHSGFSSKAMHERSPYF
ncbi:MocR-like pyridoxine biosynthesis transcription factor PdxR [Paenibacillus sp. UNC451MF]|uniref:MocR-like pyridoxine biosynthesis transcription factor PdxR n=1 Tax=Paenibacillus sp. UNC451MF TaxID=1449063 RepID=UPI00048E5F72|nr:PLP-dependent aminotransferase family protein [Paenibacillus sp. UNC451MF]